MEGLALFHTEVKQPKLKCKYGLQHSLTIVCLLLLFTANTKASYSVARACCRNRHGCLTTCPATLATDRNAHSLFLLPLPPLINFPNVRPPLSQNQSCTVHERPSARSRHSLPHYLISSGQGPCCTLLSDLLHVVTNQTEQNIGS